MHYHFIGIGGAGMSALARVLLERGYTVSGSDLVSTDVTERLKRAGATVFRGHDAAHINGAQAIVVSSAVPADNPELVAGSDRGIPILHRAEMLARLMDGNLGIAVAGTHGKTTTTSMISLILDKCGLDPTVVIGGELNDIGGNAKAGTGRYFVAEADESDGSFLHLKPYVALATNVEDDHLDHYSNNMENVTRAFLLFLNSVPDNGTVILCADDAALTSMKPHIHTNVITYGLDPAKRPHLLAEDLKLYGTGSAFTVVSHDLKVYPDGQVGGFSGNSGCSRTVLGRVESCVPGIHNVYNALGAMSTGLFLGLKFPEISAALKQFTGVHRRFESVGVIQEIQIIDDYAHHPTEVAAALSSARLMPSTRIVCAFQPHRYTRTLRMAERFGKSFEDADIVIVTDIYPAGENPIPGVSGKLVADEIAQHSKRQVIYVQTLDEAVGAALSILRPGDLFITVGAGSVSEVGKRVLSSLAARNGPATTREGALSKDSQGGLDTGERVTDYPRLA